MNHSTSPSLPYLYQIPVLLSDFNLPGAGGAGRVSGCLLLSSSFLMIYVLVTFLLLWWDSMTKATKKKEFIWGLQFQRFRIHNSGTKSQWQIQLRAHIMISKLDELGTKYSNEWTYKSHTHSAPHYIGIVLFPVLITLEVWVFTQFIGKATLSKSCVN